MRTRWANTNNQQKFKRIKTKRKLWVKTWFYLLDNKRIFLWMMRIVLCHSHNAGWLSIDGHVCECVCVVVVMCLFMCSSLFKFKFKHRTYTRFTSISYRAVGHFSFHLNHSSKLDGDVLPGNKHKYKRRQWQYRWQWKWTTSNRQQITNVDGQRQIAFSLQRDKKTFRTSKTRSRFRTRTFLMLVILMIPIVFGRHKTI